MTPSTGSAGECCGPCRRGCSCSERGCGRRRGAPGQPDDRQLGGPGRDVAQDGGGQRRGILSDTGAPRRGRRVHRLAALEGGPGTRPALREAGRRHRTIPRGSWSPWRPRRCSKPRAAPRCSRRPLGGSSAGPPPSRPREPRALRGRGHRCRRAQWRGTRPGTHPDILSMRDTKMNYGAEGSRPLWTQVDGEGQHAAL